MASSFLFINKTRGLRKTEDTEIALIVHYVSMLFQAQSSDTTPLDVLSTNAQRGKGHYHVEREHVKLDLDMDKCGAESLQDPGQQNSRVTPHCAEQKKQNLGQD